MKQIISNHLIFTKYSHRNPKKNGFLVWVLGIPPNPKPNPKNPKKPNTQPNTQTLKTQKTQYPSQHPTQIKWVFWV
jgi:hypothetical protein